MILTDRITVWFVIIWTNQVRIALSTCFMSPPACVPCLLELGQSFHLRHVSCGGLWVFAGAFLLWCWVESKLHEGIQRACIVWLRLNYDYEFYLIICLGHLFFSNFFPSSKNWIRQRQVLVCRRKNTNHSDQSYRYEHFNFTSNQYSV